MYRRAIFASSLPWLSEIAVNRPFPQSKVCEHQHRIRELIVIHNANRCVPR